MRAIAGVDERVDSEGRRHPWRIVVVGTPLRETVLAALPTGPTYLQNPRHPHYGDLTRLGAPLAEQLGSLTDRLADMGVDTVVMAETQRGGIVAKILGWNGIDVEHQDVAYEGDMREDPFSIGGDAGHEIAVIERRTRNGR